MDGLTFVPAAKSGALTSRGTHLPSYSAIVGMLVRFFVYFVAVLYRSGESKPKKLAASTSSELYLHKDRQRRSSRADQRRWSINPERLKGFGEEEELNGGVKTWEMKIISQEEGKLNDSATCPEDQQRNGVIVASDCNFSMAVAYHASELHIPVFVIIDDSVIYQSGLGTMGLEIYEQVPKLDAVILPAGIPSGLLASNSAALKHLNQHVFVVGVELENIPVDQQSLKMGQPVEDHTYSHPQFYRELSGFGTNSFQLTGNWVDKVVTVREEDVLISMLRLLEYERVAVDAEGALALAALVSGKLPELKGKRVAVAVSSGNMELSLMRQCMDQALILDNRVCKFTVMVTDCPGEISKLLETLAREEARILTIKQEQPYMRTDLFTSEVSCVVETRDRSHTTQLRKILTDRYPMITWVER
ncbi:hypothetical protein E2320_008240 [Naja naja]|nr:hypothetical protein E2320_008240 [Naja naja]